MSDSQNDIISSIQEIANSPSSVVSEITKKVSSKGSKNSSLLDNIKGLLTKKNMYMICGVIVLGIVAYYFLYKKKEKSSDNSDVVISLPNENVDNKFNLPMPNDPNQGLSMSQDEYIHLMQQQQLAQQQQQQMQQQSNDQQMPQIIHPNQDITDDNETQSQEPLTAKEIQNISNQLQQMQKEKA
ncbi:hypothetical protein CPAV1605_125 [seawater metagenome]|uniref:Uncharacterized protein n=1 Tax=seawater metagenome TaxID=1561972 RepID=A0A5E8CG29_9ZZZZ